MGKRSNYRKVTQPIGEWTVIKTVQKIYKVRTHCRDYAKKIALVGNGEVIGTVITVKAFRTKKHE